MYSALRHLFRRPSTSARKPAARPRLGVQQLDERILLSGPGPVTYHGGPILAHANVNSVYYGQNWNTDDSTSYIRGNMITFMSDIVKSPYMAQLGEYGVGRGTIGTAYDPVYTGPKNGDTVTESQIQSMLLSEMAAGRIPPGASGQQLYFVNLAPGVKSQFDQQNGFLGHHRSFTFFGSTVYYAVIPDTNFNTIAQMTSITSHELAEAVTDPNLRSGWFGAAGLEAEIGDGLEGQTASFVVGDHAWTVQSEWSNYYGRGIVADGSKAFMMNAPTSGRFTIFYFTEVSSSISWNNGGRDATHFVGIGLDGRFYANFVTAAGDMAGWFTVM